MPDDVMVIARAREARQLANHRRRRHRLETCDVDVRAHGRGRSEGCQLRLVGDGELRKEKGSIPGQILDKINEHARSMANAAVAWWAFRRASASMLFNLRNDIGERENLIAQRPEIARRLVALLREWERDVASEAKAAQ